MFTMYDLDSTGSRKFVLQMKQVTEALQPFITPIERTELICNAWLLECPPANL